jgi:hypothetical protein
MLRSRLCQDRLGSGLFSFVDEGRGGSTAEELGIRSIGRQGGYRLSGPSQNSDIVFAVLSVRRQHAAQILHTRASRGARRIGLRLSWGVGDTTELLSRRRGSAHAARFVKLANDVTHQS